MAHVIGVDGLRKITSDMVDDAMDLMRRSRKNLVEDNAEGASSYAGEWRMDGVATLDKDNNIGIQARVTAQPAGPVGGVVDVGGEVGTEVALSAKSTGDASIFLSVVVKAEMTEVKGA